MRLVCFLLLFTLGISINAQQRNFTRQDTLRGSITPERAWWDLTYYHLSMSVDIENRYLKGTNLIEYEVLESHQKNAD